MSEREQAGNLHDEVLERALAGAADEPDVAEHLASCAACRTEWERLGDVVRELDALAAEARADLEDARTIRLPEREAAFANQLRAGLSRQVRVRRGRRWRWAAAAAVLLAGMWVALERSRSQEEPPVWLGGPEVDCLAPRGEVAAFDTFRWEGSLPEGGRFEVRVRSLEDGRTLAETHTTRSEWSPGAAAAQWPARIEWSVSIVDAGGRVLSTCTSRASWRR